MIEGKNIPISDETPYVWIRNEITCKKILKKGDKGKKVKIIQEWLCLHGYRIVIDGDFGPATEYAVRQFQQSRHLQETGTVEENSFRSLVSPLRRALARPQQYNSYNGLIVQWARNHLAENPREVGGANRGPWVRVYMSGNQGADYPWCAGFVSFILMQAADAMKTAMPLNPTFSCDALAADAKARGLFVSERDLAKNNPPKKEMPPGSIFLRRSTGNDWTHTGLVLRFDEDTFQTIEGNTNDAGSREGYEVCRRIQGYAKKDFIRIG